MRRIPFNSVAHIYNRTRGPPEHVMKQLLKTLTSELSDYKRILDTGVGTGRFAMPLQNYGFEVVGIDIAKKMIGKAEERGVDNLLLSDACFLPFKDNSFDATVCIHLLHLISEWKTALKEICRATRRVMVSMIYTYANPVREAYNHVLKRCGYERRSLGKGEWGLKDLVKPFKSAFLVSYETKANETIAYLNQRAYSYQWEIPKDINEKIVDELKSRFAGKVFHQELRLLIWNIDNLTAFCERS